MLKKLSFGIARTGGRNFFGCITVHHRGGGLKRRYKLIDYKRRINAFGIIIKFDVDNYRAAVLSVICYFNGIVSYIIGSTDNLVWDIIFSGDNMLYAKYFIQHVLFMEIEKGLKVSWWKRFCRIYRNLELTDITSSAFMVQYLQIGTRIHNLELYPKFGAQFLRAAGVSGFIVYKAKDFVVVKLQTGFLVKISNKCMATIGCVNNISYKYERKRNAGVNRCLGKRPTVRGVAKNAKDHPHGGGRGKSYVSGPSLTPWGRLTKCRSTVNKRCYNKRVLLRFKKKKK